MTIVADDNNHGDDDDNLNSTISFFVLFKYQWHNSDSVAKFSSFASIALEYFSYWFAK